MPAPFWQQGPQAAPAPQTSFWTPTPPPITGPRVIQGLSVPSDEEGFDPEDDNPTGVQITGLAPGERYVIEAHRLEDDFDPEMQLYSGLQEDLPGDEDDSFIDEDDDTIPHPGPFSDPRIIFDAPDSGEVTAFVTSASSGEDDGGDDLFDFEIRIEEVAGNVFWAQDPAPINVRATEPNGFAMPDMDEPPSLEDLFEGDANEVAAFVQISGLTPSDELLDFPFGEDEGDAAVFVFPRIETQAELELFEAFGPEFFFFGRPDKDIVDPELTSILVFEGLLDADDFMPGPGPGGVDEPIGDNFSGPTFLGPGAVFNVPESGEVTVVVTDGFFDEIGPPDVRLLDLGEFAGEDNTGDDLIDFSVIVIDQSFEDDRDAFFQLAPQVSNVFWGPQDDILIPG